MVLRLTQTPYGPVAFGLPVALFFFLIAAGCTPLVSAGIGIASCIGAHWLVQTGLEVDTTRELQRTYYSIMGRSVGSWEPLPPIIGVTLKYFSTVSRNSTPSSRNSWGIWKEGDKRNEEIIVMLSIARSSNGLTLLTFPVSRLEAALGFAQGLADQFNVPLNTYLPPRLVVPQE